MAITLYPMAVQASNWYVYHNENWLRFESANMADLSDVLIVSPQNKDLLRYETATTKWKNFSALLTTTTTSTTTTSTTTTTITASTTTTTV